MRRLAIGALLLSVFAISSPVVGQDKEPVEPPPAEKAPPASPADRSYALGVDIGRSLKNGGIEVELAEVVKGLTDALTGKKARLTDEQLTAALQQVQRDAETRAITKWKKENEDFLVANKEKEGVKTTKSGLQYKVLKAGKGKVSPKKTDTVNTHYHGTLINEIVFDSSVRRGEPVAFRVDGVIAGWTEALQMMKVGDKWQLFVPSELAYGEEGRGNAIAPHSTLIFEVELLAIGEPEEDAPAEK
jgi:FKBP-type peptidyl-prolyl cis-trans isomerase FklB